MAGYAYQWLNPWQKSHIFYMRFVYTTKRINADIRGNNYVVVVYTDMAGDTEVKLRDRGKEMMVDRNFLDVFCEDFELFFKNRKNTMRALELQCEWQSDSEENINFQRVEVIRNRLSRFFENLLKSEAKPPKLKNIYMDTNDSEQALRIIRSLNPKALMRIFLKFSCANAEISEILSLKDWNKGHRSKVVIRLQKLTSENWDTLKNVLQYTSTFAYIYIFYKTRDENVVIDPTVADCFQIREDLEGCYIRIDPDQWPCSDQRYVDYKENDSDSETELLNHATCHSWWQLLENQDIMELVIRNLHFFDIQRLRKTCSGVRNCVDLIKPDPHISQYVIRLTATKIDAAVTQVNGEYRPVTVVCVEDEPNFGCPVAKNFYEHLKHQETRLEKLTLEFHSSKHSWEWNEASKSVIKRFTESLQGFLKTMKTLKVGKLCIGSINPDDIMQILPFVQPETLEIFDIYFARIIRAYEWNFEIDQISNHWKNAKELIMKTIFTSTPIQKINIDHFVKLDICLKTISSEDVLFLKNKLLTSSNFQKFKFSFRNSNIDENLHTLIGEPYRNINGVRQIWYFRIGSTNDYMHIVMDTRDSFVKIERTREWVPSNKSIVFSRVAKEDTPFF